MVGVTLRAAKAGIQSKVNWIPAQAGMTGRKVREQMTISTLIYMTDNEIKFKVAEQVMHNSGILLERKHLCTPEIQSSRVEEIAEYSARWASQQLDQPVVVTDAGFYIEALNGFPGPFIKFINEWLSVDDFLNLMRGKTNRRIVIRDCLAYCQPNAKPVTFCGSYRGELAIEPGRESGSPINRLFIPDGYSLPVSEMLPDEMIAYWSNVSIWQELKGYLEA
jgi:XTP/dITP diphosphohydrolase